MWIDLASHAMQHLTIAASGLFAAIALGAPLGVAVALWRPARLPILGLAGAGRTLPSIAVLTLLLPWLGVGTKPAVIALLLLALPPIVINVDLGIRSVPGAALDAATGLGMTARQRFMRVIVPFATPIALAGVRTAAVEVIASATLATFIGGGGLGDDIVRALQTNDPTLLFAGAAAVALLAFAAEFALGRLGAALEVPA